MDDPFDVTWRERSVVLGSVGLVLVTAYAFGVTYWPGPTSELLWLVPTSFFAAGKFLPMFAISGKVDLGPYQLGLVIWAMDTFTVLMVVYALEGLYWIKPLKRWLDKIQGNAALVLEAFPWIRKTALVGLVLFVLFPIAGTGALAGSFIGIFLGLHRTRLIAAVSAGGLIGGMLMAFLASNFASVLANMQAAQKDPTVKYVVIGAVVAMVVVVVWLLSRAYRKALDEASKRSVNSIG